MAEITFITDEVCLGVIADPIPAEHSIGWLLCVPVDCKINVSQNGEYYECRWRYPTTVNLVESHAPSQIMGHPHMNKAIAKVFTMWIIQTPPGWSTLLFPPLNHADLPLRAMSAVLDTDTMRFHVTMPCWLNPPDGVHFIAKGTPLVQAVPFKRGPINATVQGVSNAG